jgi:DNA-directed RNA polymerase specialized sigma24 family protein
VAVDDHEFGACFVSHDGRLDGLGVLLTGDRGQAEELAQDALVRTDRRWALVGRRGLGRLRRRLTAPAALAAARQGRPR